MPRFPSSLPALALIAATLPAGLAHAAPATAEARIQQFSVQLIDLDPNDGIIPSISFGAISYDAQSSYYLDYQRLSNDKSSTVGTTSTSGPAGTVSTFSAADSWSTQATLDGNHVGTTTATGAVYYRASYTLSAATQAVFTIDGTVSAIDPGNAATAYASAHMASQLSAQPAEWPYYNSFGVDKMTTGSTEAFSLNGEVRSLAGEEAYDWLEISTEVITELYGPATPVPEPSTYAMLLAGAAIVGGVARRRRAQG